MDYGLPDLLFLIFFVWAIGCALLWKHKYDKLKKEMRLYFKGKGEAVMKRFFVIIACVLLVGCAGMSRECSNKWASATGSDWVIVQYNFDGEPICAWKLENVSVSNEDHSDGIYWQDSSGHLVHISGWYNRVQVKGHDFEGAARLLGINIGEVRNGKYSKSLINSEPKDMMSLKMRTK